LLTSIGDPPRVPASAIADARSRPLDVADDDMERASWRTEVVMKRVVFACIHNAGRSQIAAAFFSAIADPPRVQAISAGTQPGDRVHPEVVDVMREVGIDLSAARPQRLTDELARGAELLITMGCGDECPYVPGLRRDDWPVRDPQGRAVDEVRRIRDDIRQRVSALVDAHGWRKITTSP
jgi:arsenate reductase